MNRYKQDLLNTIEEMKELIEEEKFETALKRLTYFEILKARIWTNLKMLTWDGELNETE